MVKDSILSPIVAMDSHAHLDMAKGGEAEALAWLDRAFAAGLQGVIAIAGATKVGEYEDTLYLARKNSRIRVAAGIHPHAASAVTLSLLEKLSKTLDDPLIVAVGEIGLDYHYEYSDRPAQRHAFVQQLRISRKLELPVVIHTREADDDTLAILRDEGAQEQGGVIHCFSSGEAFAQQAMALGFYISFSGIVTFPTAEDIQRVAQSMPLDKMLVETDSPFLSPIPFRGRPNEPSRVVHVVEKIAELRNLDAYSLGQMTVENTLRCFRLDAAFSDP